MSDFAQLPAGFPDIDIHTLHPLTLARLYSYFNHVSNWCIDQAAKTDPRLGRIPDDFLIPRAQGYVKLAARMDRHALNCLRPLTDDQRDIATALYHNAYMRRITQGTQNDWPALPGLVLKD